MQTMYFDADHIFEPIARMMMKKKQIGADVRLNVDYFSELWTAGDINALPIYSAEKRRYNQFIRLRKREMLKELETAEVAITHTNPPKNYFERILPSSGRNHTKIAIVDQTAWIGGLSLFDLAFQREDCMVRIDDTRIVDALAKQFQMVNAEKPRRDYEHQCTEDTTILVDNGTKGQSIILDRAKKLVLEAKKTVQFVTQFTPDGEIVPALILAQQKGKAVEIITSSSTYITERTSYIFERVNQLALAMKNRRLAVLEYPNWMHTKLLVIDADYENHGAVLTGSHNLSGKGVDMGNEELCLHSTNSTFVKNAAQYFAALRSKSQLR